MLNSPLVGLGRYIASSSTIFTQCIVAMTFQVISPEPYDANFQVSTYSERRATNAYCAPPMRTPHRGGQSPLTPGEKPNGHHALIKVVLFIFFKKTVSSFPPLRASLCSQLLPQIMARRRNQ